MDVSNASLYDGSTAMVEAALMAWRIKNKPKILISRAIHPEYREVARTYFKNLNIELIEINYNATGETNINELKEKINHEVAGIIVQSPNFFGVIEKIEKISEIARSSGILMITTVTEPLSFAILKPPGECGVDIVAGEGQSFGLPLSFGGPYLGILACKSAFVRQMPGRIVGETQDIEGERGYVLTLSTREQHIRREKATSNICTNQAWCAIRATIYLTVMGKKGLKELALQNLQKANYARKELSKIDGVNIKFNNYFFNEFVIELKKESEWVNKRLNEEGIIGGLCLKRFYPELENCFLICVTEIHTKNDIDRFVKCLKKILKS
jgi:glycine dehydrogenase subunit 1